MKKSLISLGSIIMVVGLVWGVFYWSGSGSFTKVTTNSLLTTPKINERSSYLLDSSSDAITIKNKEVVIKIITLKDILSFDSNDFGTPSNPVKDYAFDDNPLLDNTYGVLYFSVYNRTTAGNANANRALFSYNVTNKKLTLLKKEEFSVSFASLYTSGDGNHLVYSDGNHGGMCYETLGLGVYDLKNNKDLGTFFLPTTTTGVIEFDHWVDSSSFIYKEETFLNVDKCRNSYNENPQVNYKTYRISPPPLWK